MAKSIGCVMASAMFSSIKSEIESLIKAPLAMLSQARRMASKLSSSLTSAFTQLMNDVGSILDGLPTEKILLKDLLAALTALQKCSAILASPEATSQLALAKSTLQKYKKAADIPSWVKSYLNKTITSAALAAFNKTMNDSVFGKLNKMGQAYNKMLKTSGISKAMSDMDKLIECMNSMCDTVSTASLYLESAKESLGVDSATNRVKDAANNLYKNVPVSSVKVLNSANTYITASYNKINNFKMEIV